MVYHKPAMTTFVEFTLPRPLFFLPETTRPFFIYLVRPFGTQELESNVRYAVLWCGTATLHSIWMLRMPTRTIRMSLTSIQVRTRRKVVHSPSPEVEKHSQAGRRNLHHSQLWSFRMGLPGVLRLCSTCRGAVPAIPDRQGFQAQVKAVVVCNYRSYTILSRYTKLIKITNT